MQPISHEPETRSVFAAAVDRAFTRLKASTDVRSRVDAARKKREEKELARAEERAKRINWLVQVPATTRAHDRRRKAYLARQERKGQAAFARAQVTKRQNEHIANMQSRIVSGDLPGHDQIRANILRPLSDEQRKNIAEALSFTEVSITDV